jgi:flagellar biosynthesis/type III secretory pathway chaperone
MATDRAERLRTLLEEERSALRDGAFDRLEDILARKEALQAELTGAGLACSEQEAAALRALARRNGELLEAARRGLRAAMDRVAERTRLARHLDTYDASGARRTLSPPPGSLHRRY